MLVVCACATVCVLSSPNSLDLTANSHPASETESFFVSITDQVWLVYQTCAYVFQEKKRQKKRKSGMINLPAFRRVKEIDAG